MSMVETEKTLLAYCLNSNDMAKRLVDLVTPQAFSPGPQRAVYETVCRMVDNGDPVSTSTVAEQMGSALADIGGIVYLAEVEDCVGSKANFLYWVGKLREQHKRRQAHEIGLRLDKAADATQDIDSELRGAVAAISSLQSEDEAESVTPLRCLLRDNFEHLEKIYAAGKGTFGISSGFADLDALTSGYQRGHFYVVAGRPAMGKTAFAMACGLNAAAKGHRVFVQSLEMAAEDLSLRLLCSTARVNSQHIREGTINTQDWKDLSKAAGMIGEYSLSINDDANANMGHIAARCRQNGPVDLLIVDYLQLLRGEAGLPREQQVAGISRQAKLIAKELNCAVVGVAQLNRGVESRAVKRPQLSDLRESGAIEQDADMVMFIYRPWYYDPTDHDERDKAYVIVAKNRHGPTGEACLRFKPEYTRFDNLHLEDGL